MVLPGRALARLANDLLHCRFKRAKRFPLFLEVVVLVIDVSGVADPFMVLHAVGDEP